MVIRNSYFKSQLILPIIVALLIEGTANQTITANRSRWVGACKAYTEHVTAFFRLIYFSIPFLLWKKGTSGSVTQWRQLFSCDFSWHSHGSLIQRKFDLKINRSLKTLWQEYRGVAWSYSSASAANQTKSKVNGLLVSKETVVLRWWKSETKIFGFIERVDKAWITTGEDLEADVSSIGPSSERIEELWGVVGLYESGPNLFAFLESPPSSFWVFATFEFCLFCHFFLQIFWWFRRLDVFYRAVLGREATRHLAANCGWQWYAIDLPCKCQHKLWDPVVYDLSSHRASRNMSLCISKKYRNKGSPHFGAEGKNTLEGDRVRSSWTGTCCN